MASRAELSALVSALEEVTRRVTAVAESTHASKDEELAHELFRVERSLNGALRQLRRVSGSLS
jgi:hypothetical protein